ncbi:MAG: DNA mismatch repair endonuclease MutL [Clostridiales bacterium]|jgi:DNA mismatch repair protein MutL|nr:DNA mismatch repair endonuclease MutL [Clostridiales bacterium]
MIKLLENSLINKIAAGEVVERPLSVVKELAENALDAGARAVSIEIRDGGISYIKISDDGAGILRDEVKTAFLRHATSKISSFDDLTNITSLGFRGEALASVASVSRLVMTTKTRGEKIGTRIEIHGGQIMDFGGAGAPDGTSVEVRELFYNTPARRKFLKKPPAEMSYIHEFAGRLALSRPDAAFKFFNNGQAVFATNGAGDLKTAIYYVYGKETAEKLLPVEREEKDARISGFIAKPEAARGNRSYGNFFVNGRFIRNETLYAAVLEAYKGRLFSGKFPVFALNLRVEPGLVDVNVHPQKMEVRFADEPGIYKFVLESVREAFYEAPLIAEVKWGAESARVRKPLSVSEAALDMMEERAAAPGSDEQRLDVAYEPKKPSVSLSRSEGNTGEPPGEAPQREQAELLPVESGERDNANPFENGEYTIVGRVFGVYWLVTARETMYLIDQHAAHERIMYEEFLEKFRNGEVRRQILLQPRIVSLSPRDAQTARENAELLWDLGFDADELSENKLIIRAVPYIFKKPAESAFFNDVIDALRETGKTPSGVYDFKLEKIASLSCRAAVKANDALTESECRELITDLLRAENPFNCPHGRPTIIRMSRYEIEKKFKRV